MTKPTRGSRRIVLTDRSDAVSMRPRPSADDVAAVVIVAIGQPAPVGQQIDVLSDSLRATAQISIGIASGRLDATATTILRACDFVVAGRGAVLGDIGAEEAYRTGLVIDVSDDPEAAADGLAEELSRMSGGALTATKVMIDAVPGSDLASALTLESNLQVERLASAAHRRIMAEQVGTRTKDR